MKRTKKLSKKDIINPGYNRKTQEIFRVVLHKSEKRQEELLKRAAKL